MIGKTNAQSGSTNAEIIQFTISNSTINTTYCCENGMTWSEWCNSGYNTAGSTTYIKDDNTVVYFNTNVIDNVTASDVIISGYTYTFTFTSNGSND